MRAKRGELLTKCALAFKKERDYNNTFKDFDAALAIVQKGDAAFYTNQIESGAFHHLHGDFEVAKTCFGHALTAKPQSIFAIGFPHGPPKPRPGGQEAGAAVVQEGTRREDQRLHDVFHRGQLRSIDIMADGSNAEEAIALVLRHLENYIHLGVTHACTDNFEQAVEYLKTATMIMPDAPEVYSYLSETYVQLQQVPGSGSDFDSQNWSARRQSRKRSSSTRRTRSSTSTRTASWCRRVASTPPRRSTCS